MRLPIAKGAFIVSYQARGDNPLHGPYFMAAMAQAAEQGGACGIRANGAADIKAIRAATALPIIGLNKRLRPEFPVYITPDFASAKAVAEAGADIIAIDATRRPRDGEALEQLIPQIRQSLGKPVMADVATLEEALHAVSLGADCVGTTLSGYTEETLSKLRGGPDFALLRALVARLPVPVIAEGRYETPGRAREALRLGAYAVVVGTAITNPREIARKFAEACAKAAIR